MEMMTDEELMRQMAKEKQRKDMIGCFAGLAVLFAIVAMIVSVAVLVVRFWWN